MQLDYNPRTEVFILRLAADERGQIQTLMNEHGLDFSVPASTGSEAVLFTREPYAAVAFYRHASQGAREQLRNLKHAIDLSWKSASGAHIEMPPDAPDLWPFQKAGIEFAMNHGHVLIGDQPGLGKTNQAIGIANEMHANNVLVICPASIRLQWLLRIRDLTTMPWPYIMHPILSSRSGVHPHANWTVAGFEMASTEPITRALTSRWYDLLIIDEAHYLKESDSRRTKAVFLGDAEKGIPSIASRCAKVVALTGTPLPNRPREAFTLAKNLCHESIDWLNEHAFAERFNPRQKKQTKHGAVFVDERRGRFPELGARLRANFMVRREKHGQHGVMKQLHMPIYDIIQLEKTGPVKQALEAESLLEIDPENFQGKDAKALGHIATVQRMMGVALAPQIADYIEMLLDGGEEKLVLFAKHIEVLDIFESRLKKRGVLRVDGRTSANMKQKLINQFVTDPKIAVMAGNMLAMGVGTDGLQKVSNHVLIAEPDWVPGNNMQAIDRLDRGGQRDQVQADIFVAPNSIAERVLASALRKGRMVHKTLDEFV
jgi:SWI/SNF-related matrix-associated actin-dependent regulator 1 of chromatin subfamily A